MDQTSPRPAEPTSWPSCAACGEQVSVLTGLPVTVTVTGGVATITVDTGDLGDADLACGCTNGAVLDPPARGALAENLRWLARNYEPAVDAELPEFRSCAECGADLTGADEAGIVAYHPEGRLDLVEAWACSGACEAAHDAALGGIVA